MATRCEGGAVSLGYDLIKFARMCTAVRYVAMDAVVGAPLGYAYELAAGPLEVHPKAVSRWFRGFRSKQYFVHMTGEMKSKLVNESPPCQLSGSQPVGLCTPEAIGGARQHVCKGAVRKGQQNLRIEDFQKWLNNELLTRGVLNSRGLSKAKPLLQSLGMSLYLKVWT